MRMAWVPANYLSGETLVIEAERAAFRQAAMWLGDC